MLTPSTSHKQTHTHKPGGCQNNLCYYYIVTTPSSSTFLYVLAAATHDLEALYPKGGRGAGSENDV